jgi:lycopene beta-cyclase
VADKLDGAVLADAPVESLTPTSVTLSDGRLLEAGAVIDGRGGGVGPHLHVAYQKFLGREVQLTEPHNLEMPVLMDSTVDQRDGYRFVYLLPLEPNRILVEDTYYSDTPSLDKEALRVRIESYMSARGWSATSVLREESGILPIVLGGNVDAHIDSLEAGVPTVGLRGGFFHATTGYSLPYAVRIADLIAAQADLGASALHRLLQHQARAHWRRQRFYQLLNRMLFLAAAPDTRHLVMRRFYGLPAPLISRFYAGHTTLADKARILTGRPPVPIRAALRALAPRRLQTYSRNVQA